MIFGEFTKEKNTLGTILQIETSIVGVDVIGDARDVAADLSNWKWTKEHLGKTVLDVIGLFKVIGVIKYGDEVVDIAKQADNISDASKKVKTVEGGVETLAKYGDDSGKMGVYVKNPG